MAWLADIAAKTEIFLNKIDKNAAVALNNSGITEKESRPKKSEPFLEPNDERPSHKSYYAPTDQSKSVVANSGPSNSDTNTSSVNKTGNSTSKRTLSSNKTSSEVNSIENLNLSSASNSNNFTSTNKKPSKQNGVEKKLTISKNTTSGSITNSSAPIPDEEQLIAFLNSSEPNGGLNESLILKDEVETQARELKLLTQNHRSLQKDYEHLKGELEANQKKLANEEASRHSNEADEQDLRKLLEEKNSELHNLLSRHQQALEAIQKLELSQDNLQKLEQSTLENSQLRSENESLLQRTEILSSQVETAENHVLSMKSTLSSMEKEFTNYKEKAKSILSYKDELITSLKNEDTSTPRSDSSANTAEELLAEVTALKNDRELLQADLSQTRATVESLKEDNVRLEKEVSTLRYFTEDLSSQLKREKEVVGSLQSENLQVCQQLNSLQFELERESNERKKVEEQVAKYKDNSKTNSSLLTSSSEHNGYLPGNSEKEMSKLKMRINALSQSLYEKQSLINDMSTDKQLLQIEVERLKNDLRESKIESNDFCQGVGNPQTVIASQPLYLSESPWDSRVSARMKRIYTQIDSVFCQFGLALRKRPNLRLGMSVYVIILHLWVFFVLFSWMHQAAPE